MTEFNSTAPGYKWVIVFASAIMLAIAMGVMVNGISVFFASLKEEFGWARGAVSLINFSGLMGLAIGGVVMGRVADRTSIRKVCLFGSLVLGSCVLGAAWADQLWQFYLLFFLAGLLGAGSLLLHLLQMWATGSRVVQGWHSGLHQPVRRWDRVACLSGRPY